MTNKTAAARYARALLEKALLNPVVPVPRKRAAMGELTARAKLLPIVGKLVAVLAERDRLALVPDLLAAFRSGCSFIAASCAPISSRPRRSLRIGRNPSRQASRA